MEDERKFPCPCCGTANQIDVEGLFCICRVCGWEDDNLQRDDPDYDGGPNGPITLNLARRLWASGKTLFPGYPNPRAKSPEVLKKFPYPCPVCGAANQNDIEYDSGCVCEVCGWKDDGYLLDHPDEVGEAHKWSYNMAKETWEAGGDIFPGHPNPKGQKTE